MQNQMNFEAKNKKLSDVLFAQRKFRVPRFQRPYAWDSEEVSEFWEDLTLSKEPYFFGSFIFNSEQEKDAGFIDIIDGQQRLLTITIFISVLRDLVKSLDPKTAHLYQIQDIAILDRLGNQTYRILPSDTLNAYVKDYIQSGENDIFSSEPSSPEELRVKKNYEYFSQQIKSELERYKSNESKIEVLNNLRQKVSDLIVIHVEISREEDAYEIFETTNARGIDLSVGDLLKNLIFSKIKPEVGRDFAKDAWGEIISNIEATNTELKKFIRYFWISKHSPCTEKRLFREIKNSVTDWGDLLQELWDASAIYNKLLEGSKEEYSEYKHGYKIYESIFALRLMGVTQCFVLLMSIFRNFKKLGTDPSRIIKIIENFSFKYSVVCKMPSNKVEKIYSRSAIDIENAASEMPDKKISGKIQSIFSELEKTFRNISPSEIQFKESFNSLSYKSSEESRRLIKYILGKFDNYYERTDEHLIDFNRVNIEHVLPKNPCKKWGLSRGEIRDYVNSLGNLTLLSKILNSKIQNGTISDKLPELELSELAVTRKLVEFIKISNGEWNSESIAKRQSEFADLAYHRIWKL
jgi:uncharacterized protein with ParB-like and HNH nuclease domain